jgi:uncharacterized membrane protein
MEIDVIMEKWINLLMYVLVICLIISELAAFYFIWINLDVLLAIIGTIIILFVVVPVDYMLYYGLRHL